MKEQRLEIRASGAQVEKFPFAVGEVLAVVEDRVVDEAVLGRENVANRPIVVVCAFLKRSGHFLASLGRSYDVVHQTFALGVFLGDAGDDRPRRLLKGSEVAAGYRRPLAHFAHPGLKRVNLRRSGGR